MDLDGHINNNVGDNETCRKCPEGRFQSNHGQSNCNAWKNCPPGRGRKVDDQNHYVMDIACEICNSLRT